MLQHIQRSEVSGRWTLPSQSSSPLLSSSERLPISQVTDAGFAEVGADLEYEKIKKGPS